MPYEDLRFRTKRATLLAALELLMQQPEWDQMVIDRIAAEQALVQAAIDAQG